MKKKKGNKEIDLAGVQEELDHLLELVKKRKSALKKLSKSIPGSNEQKKSK
jgi:hypothetical protein